MNTLENLFTEDDINELEDIQKIRKNLLKNIGVSNFIDMMRDIIDESEIFEFTSATKRKFININTPIFTLRKKNYQVNPNILKNQTKTDEEINNIVNEISNNILNKTTKKIVDFIQTDEKLQNIYSNINEDIKDLIWTTVFEIRVSLKDNIIYMRYCI